MWHDGSAGSLTTVNRVRQTGQQLFVSAHVVMHARQKEVWPQPSSAAFRLGREKQMTHVSSSSVPRRRRRSGRVLAWSSSTPISDDAAAESAAAGSIEPGKWCQPVDGQDEKQPTVVRQSRGRGCNPASCVGCAPRRACERERRAAAASRQVALAAAKL